jgi:hypothetical protein
MDSDTRLEVGQRVFITPDLRGLTADGNNGRNIGDQKS